MNPPFESELRAELERLEREGRRRSLVPASHADGLVDFASNDYLGLARHPKVIEASGEALRAYGAGARASRLLGGGCPHDANAEAQLADWLGAEAALLFPTGFQANLGLVTTLARRGDTLFSDELIHASLVDACRLSRAAVRVFAHNDVHELNEILDRAPKSGRRLVLVESIYSMGGDRAPLRELQQVCAEHDAWLVVDEAHAVGVLGPRGAGAWAAVADEFGDRSRLLARVVTGGKSLGAAGGFVLGSRQLRELLLQSARSFIFTTGAPPAVSGALAASIPLARAADDERAHLQTLATKLRSALHLDGACAAIHPFTVGDNVRSVDLARSLRDEGIDLRAVRPPTVPEGRAGLRIVLHSFNTEQDIERLIEALHDVPRAETPIVVSSKRARPIFVVGTDTEIGKTVVSALLTRHLASHGEVTYWKPVQTGDDSDTETVRRLAQGTRARCAEPTYEFPLPASPHEAAAAAEAAIDRDRLDERLDAELEAAQGALLVELAGGLLVPYDDERTQIDWLAERRPRIVMVARSGLGTLNHTLLSLEAARARKLEIEALFLVGDAHASNAATLRRMSGIDKVFELPRLDPLSPEGLDAWIEQATELPR